MGTPVSRVAYAYLRQEETESQEKNNTEFTSSKNILRRLLNIFHKSSKSSNLEV